MSEVTLGGDRLGSGKKQTVELHNYGMNSFNLEQDWKSSMAPGVLYPFLQEIGTNHGTFDIDLDSFVRTLPTQGPLFGSFKLQADLFCVPIRLYQGILHNNPVGIGLKMNQVYLPKLKITTKDGKGAPQVEGTNAYNCQVSENALIKYLGISGLGHVANQQIVNDLARKFNAVPMLAYYDIFKCYYSNKQEENAYVITPGTLLEVEPLVTQVAYSPDGIRSSSFPYPYTTWNVIDNYSDTEDPIEIEDTMDAYPNMAITIKNEGMTWEDICDQLEFVSTDETITLQDCIDNNYIKNLEHRYTDDTKKYLVIQFDIDSPNNWTDVFLHFHIELNYTQTKYTTDIHLEPFALANIDDMRNALLSSNTLGSEFVLGSGLNDNWNTSSGSDETGLPYSALFNTTTDGLTWNAFNMNGLVVKTYQSDLFNNWLDTEFIDGENGISAISAVDTSGGSFTMDTLNLAEKIYELLNRVLVSGGTYEDWQEAVYGEGAVRKSETPMYIGGMAAEIMFEEVIANTEAGQGEEQQVLGSLGGKGTQVGKRGGNNIHVKCDEPSYIIGIVSITPRICYSQGNRWDMTDIDTLDDLHKPALDGIGFQDLMVEQMAWWNTVMNPNGSTSIMHRDACGKQTAWINYQTAVDKCYGDFAKADGYAFMVLNRNYEIGSSSVFAVKDLTTYIDPTKYNYAFAVKSLYAQNFWVQIHSKVIARRKMGAQQIPNL